MSGQGGAPIGPAPLLKMNKSPTERKVNNHSEDFIQPPNLIFTMMSPDSLTPVTCVQCEPDRICEENRVPVADLPILVFSWEYQLSPALFA